ncbi:hypothetical protein BCR34DRAFT_325393 [Clohesyomyces aquaticus]|uniref:DUF7730 domain-containing protein n=1 Tax=Clohesyomyces aquaticus TaxID=1231657 RepID=A0A1Y1ZMT0_9PLEO|nr:hypothetical protein BCR34DRAFT_325393 [Clohesyomyces aquaticus]
MLKSIFNFCFPGLLCCLFFPAPRKQRGTPMKRNPKKLYFPRKPPVSLEPRNEQTQSWLFGSRFPAELRIAIYEAVLGDPNLLMHIIPFDDFSERVGRQRCEDAESAGPTWQHTCFGTRLEINPASIVRKSEFWSDDKLLALLLSCHRIYSEAISILYTANLFSLKGSRGIVEMRSITPDFQWHMIRHLHISTIFLTPESYWPEFEWFPPDNYKTWREGCSALEELRGIHRLRLEIGVFDTYDRKNPTAVEENALVSILEPLSQVMAPLFEVEMNLAIPQAVRETLGKMTFTLVVKHRPYNTELYTV